MDQSKIRNIAIIAHVDHGKTTLVDSFLKQTHVFHENQEELLQEQLLDTGELEREKGITIKAKNVSVNYKDYLINIIDTPGHADFGGEVERTLNMADGCILVVDAGEGPMPQTKFVLKKALELNLKLLVIINKIDKKIKNLPDVHSRLDDLVLELAINQDQLNFKTFYAIAKSGQFFDHLPENESDLASQSKDVSLILDDLTEEFPSPTGDPSAPFQMRITNLENDPYYGLMLVGKIERGELKEGDSLAVVSQDDKSSSIKGKVKKIFTKKGIKYENVHSAQAGEIIAVAGIDTEEIGATLCATNKLDPLPKIEISPPSVVVKFEANTSPFVGQEGKFVNIKQIAERLKKEGAQNISLEITPADSLGYFVKGRGELQLSILMETMRREGYEFQVRKPEVVYKEIDGKQYEPLEDLNIEVPEEYIGTVTTIMTERSGNLIDMKTIEGIARFEYKILTRNILGLRSSLINSTKGNVVMSSFISDYIEVQPQRELYRNGVLIASETGTATGYALNTIQERGDLFVTPGTKVYEGMIVGINKYPEDMDVNAAKERHKSAVRMNHAEVTLTRLKSPIDLTLDFALSFLAKDELLEITPKNLRLRKMFLNKNDRIKARRRE